MISRRDNLLIKPWEQRRYENHRKKVLSAVPAIDNREPATRMHVLIKLKKQQKEKEKHEKIERDNFTLLRKLSYIMRTNRVDNCWITPQPNFLNRMAMFEANPKYKEIEEDQLKSQIKIGRRGKCFACTPQKVEEIRIPEERIPWEPEKLPVSKKIRSQSVPFIKKSIDNEWDRFITQERTKSCKARIENTNKQEKRLSLQVCSSPTMVTFQRGSLKLAVNIPTDTTIKLHEKNTCKVLYGRDCFCRNVTKTRTG